jgi:hypothetical protein
MNNMKRYITIILLMCSTGVMAQFFSPTVDTLKFKDSRGNIYEALKYGSDSIQINGVMLRNATCTSTTNYWATAGTGYIQPTTSTDVLKYPGIPYWNYTMKLNTDGPVWYKKSDNTLRGHILVPETIPGTQTSTINCGDGMIYLYETEASDLSVTINYIDSIPEPVIFHNLGKNSTLTITSIESLPFDSTGTTSISLEYGEWARIIPATTRFITESNVNQSKFNEYYTKVAADTVFVKSTEDSLYRYAVYESGNNIIEVLATTKEVTASLANSNEFTFTIPSGTKILSAKIRVENLSSVVCIIGTGDMANDSMKDRWMPTVAGWREDTGQQLMGMTTLMDLSNYSKFTVNGLINTTICQIRIGF